MTNVHAYYVLVNQTLKYKQMNVCIKKNKILNWNTGLKEHTRIYFDLIVISSIERNFEFTINLAVLYFVKKYRLLVSNFNTT